MAGCAISRGLVPCAMLLLVCVEGGMLFVAGTQGSASDSLQALWQEYEFISGVTKVIREKQGPSPNPLPDRKEKIADFEKWLSENGATYSDMVRIMSVHLSVRLIGERSAVEWMVHV